MKKSKVGNRNTLILQLKKLSKEKSLIESIIRMDKKNISKIKNNRKRINDAGS